MPPENKPKIIVIAGPTASGKTGLAVALALSLGGEIINADSMQIYRNMDVGTAKPTLEEQHGVIHHLLDIVDPNEDFNAAMYRKIALPLAKGIYAKNIPCFVVGGTGLYIRSLLGGLVELPLQTQYFGNAYILNVIVKGHRSYTGNWPNWILKGPNQSIPMTGFGLSEPLKLFTRPNAHPLIF